ncbi:MAG: hypothetical protein PVJ40_02695 [Gammaproteobacteria bacterium]
MNEQPEAEPRYRYRRTGFSIGQLANFGYGLSLLLLLAGLYKGWWAGIGKPVFSLNSFLHSFSGIAVIVLFIVSRAASGWVRYRRRKGN